MEVCVTIKCPFSCVQIQAGLQHSRDVHPIFEVFALLLAFIAPFLLDILTANECNEEQRIRASLHMEWEPLLDQCDMQTRGS